MDTFQNGKLALSIKEFCDATSLGKSTVYARIADGSLKATRISGRRLILISEARRFLTGGDDHVAV